MPLFHDKLRLCLQDETSLHDTRQPLLLWQTSLWAAMHACYTSGKRGDLVDLSERLALCLVMLSLVPEKARHTRTVRLMALAREAKRGAGKSVEDGEVRHIFFRALSAGKPISGPPQETPSGYSNPGQVKMQGSAHDQAPCALCTAHALIRPSPSPSPRKRKQKSIEMSPAISDDVPELSSSSPFYNRGSADSGWDTAPQLSPLSSCAALGTRQGFDEVDDAGDLRPSHAAGENSPGISEGAQAPSRLPSEGKSGSLFVIDQDSSSDTSSRDMSVCSDTPASPDVDSLAYPERHVWPLGSPKKGNGSEEAGTEDRGRQRMQKKREGGPVGGDGVARKAPRHSECQKVGSLINQLVSIHHIVMKSFAFCRT